MILVEGAAMCFWLLLICVVGIANGPVGLVIFYEPEVHDRVIELGLTTKEKIKKAAVISGIAMYVPILTVLPVMVYGLNGASGFMEGFLQMTAILLIEGLFDRIFIDIFWVGHTNAWLIPGTEDLKPYIPKKTAIKKWIGTLVGFPLISAIVAGIVSLLFK